MKTRIITILGLALAGFCAPSRADSTPQLPSDFAFTLEARSAMVSTNKWGFTWPSNCCPPVVRYFKQREMTNWISVMLCATPEEVIWWSGLYADHSITRAVAGIGTEGDFVDTNLLCDGTFTLQDGRSGTRDCGGWTVTGGGYWATGPFGYECSFAGWQCYFWYSSYAYQTCWDYWWSGLFGPQSGVTTCNESTITNTIPDWQIIPSGYAYVQGTNIAHVFLSNEFTTSEMIGMLVNNLTNDYQPCGNLSPHATASIREDESHATGQAVQARFKVFAAANDHWEINFQRCRIGYSNGVQVVSNGTPVVTRTDDKIEGIGTGGWIYTNISLEAAFSTYTSNNCVYYQGAETWIEVGCGNSLGCSGGSCGLTAGSTSADLGDSGARVVMGLGPSAYGEGSASLVLMAARPAAEVTTPASLEPYGNWTGVTLLKSNGHVRQVLTQLGILADVVTTNSSSFIVNFYSAYSGTAGEDGLYSVTNLSPFATTTIAQGTSTNRLVVTVDTGSAPQQLVYDWSETDQGWTLTSGGGIRKESRLWNEATLARTVTVQDANNQIVSQGSKSYQNLTGFGRVLTTQVQGPGTAYPPRTQWCYYDNASTDGINYGKLKLVIEPSGSWRRYQYDTQGRLTNELSQFLNAATNAAFNQCRAVTYDYTSLDGTNQFETRTEWLAGSNISRTITATLPGGTYSIRCVTPNSAWTDSANLVTITRYYTAGDNAGKVQSVLNPDGTAQAYAYDTDSAGRLTTAWSGAADSSGTNVILGTRTESYVYATGVPCERFTYDLSYQNSWITYEIYTVDDLGRVIGTSGNQGTTAQNYGCCGLYSSVDRQGTTTIYLYDDLKRQVGTMVGGIARTNLLDAAGNALASCRVGTDNSVMRLYSASYDAAGRLLTETNALSGVTTYSESRDGSGQTVKTITYADGGQRIETYYQDGSLRSATGSAAFPVYYAYGVDADGAFTKETKDSESGTEWTKSSTDYLGRSYKTVYADNASSRFFYNSQGQLWKQVDPDGVTTLYQYGAKGELEYTAIDMNTNGVVDFDGTDRITGSISDVLDDNGAVVRRTRSYVWDTLNSAASNLVSTVEASADGLQSWQTQYRDPNTAVNSSSQTTYGANGARSVTTTAPDNSYSIITYSYDRLVSVTSYDSGGSQISSTSYGYDFHGRQKTVADARSGTTTMGYNSADLPTSVTTPNPGTLASTALTTLTYYNTMLQATSVLQPDGTTVTSEYYLTGELKRQYGSRTYPVGYGYDYAGRMKAMTNWSGFPSAGARVTTWNYNPYRGWLDSKHYPDGQGPAYAYTPAGRLQTRTWARTVSGQALTTTYGFDNSGAVKSVRYSDSTPGITNSYDRLGRQATALRNGMTTTFAYNTANEVLTESYSGGTLNGFSITNSYDAYLRRATLAIRNSNTQMVQHVFGYDSASRLESVTDNSGATAYSATYSYLANSPLVSQIVFKQSTTTRMTTTKQYDYLNRLLSVSSTPSPVSFGYSCNNANQRIRSTLADGSYWLYQYDSLGQVIAGNKYWADGTPVAGQQFEYAHDTIGNRTSTKAGGDQNGANLRSASYLANNLNQYTNRTVPGAVDVMGVSFATNTVTVNNQTAYRKGEYFRQQLTVTNASTPVWQSVTNAATGQSSITGNAFVAKTPELFYYDADGNLTNDGCWRYAWDAENRLVSLTTNTAVGPRQSIKFEYDWRGRRIRKQVWSNASWNGTPTNDVKFVYDGWNLLAELNATNNVTLRSYLWGSDLSGSLQGAGGVGGLLKVTYNGTQTTNCFVAYDGNGNVAALADGASTNIFAQYEYGPFGEVIRATGPMSRANPFRFSTKYQDDEADLLYYGYRYYSASSGRWLNPDPIGAGGGANPWVFLGNDGVDDTDILGLWSKVGRGGHVWAAETGDTLAGLARKYGASPDDWPCLWPTDGTGDHGYPNLIRPCDRYDASNLAVPAPGATKLQVVVDPDHFFATQYFVPGAKLVTPQKVPSLIKSVSGEGGTPISDFLSAGHGGFGGYWPHKNAQGKWRQYRVPDLVALDEPPSFARASSRKGPLRCWFSRDAAARFLGCGSGEYMAAPLANKVLRKGAVAWGTNQMVGWGGGKLYWDYTGDDKPGESTKNWLSAPVWVKYPGAL
jgi:RHS repeat-associated protein